MRAVNEHCIALHWIALKAQTAAMALAMAIAIATLKSRIEKYVDLKEHAAAFAFALAFATTSNTNTAAASNQLKFCLCNWSQSDFQRECQCQRLQTYNQCLSKLFCVPKLFPNSRSAPINTSIGLEIWVKGWRQFQAFCIEFVYSVLLGLRNTNTHTHTLAS